MLSLSTERERERCHRNSGKTDCRSTWHLLIQRKLDEKPFPARREVNVERNEEEEEEDDEDHDEQS